MKATMICIIGLMGAWGNAMAEPLVEGHVRLASGAPVPGAQVLLFDVADLRAAPLAATTDLSGHFTLSLATLEGALPERFGLGANYPNPFNPSTMIPYRLPAAMHVRLEVFNLLGQRVSTLVDGERPAGSHTASWDATDAAGEAVSAGVYLYRLSGAEAQATRSMLLIDGQAGIPFGGPTGPEDEARAGEGEGRAPVYGLTVSARGLVPYVDAAFRVETATSPLDLVVEAPGRVPPAKAASSGGILGDVDNTGGVDFFDALLVALYSLDASVVMPNDGDISLGDVNADGQIDMSDAWILAEYLDDPSNPALPAGIGEPVGPAASLSPDPSTVTFADDGAWHRFTVQAAEPVWVVTNPEGTTPRLEITTRSGRSNFCPAEAEDAQSRQDGQAIYLAGCGTGTATVELRRRSDGTVLRTYTFEVTGSPAADLVVESLSVSDSTLTPGQRFTLNATVRNQGTGAATATTLRYYRSSQRVISIFTRDATQVGTDAVDALGASRTSAESISLSAPSTEGTYYYGACVAPVAGEDFGSRLNNCSSSRAVTVEDVSVTGDRDALVALYNATNGPNWKTRTNWLSDRPVGEWHGVTTDANGRVTGLQLSSNQLTGDIPAELGSLSALEGLSLDRNQLSGSIPPELASLENLTDLRLYLNRLSGSIPAGLGSLESLTVLNLTANGLSGSIPAELGNLENLESLFLGRNQLTGPIPAALGSLSKLAHLFLYGNAGLSGPLPGSLSGLSRLSYLYVDGTGLCAPADAAFQGWLEGIETKRGVVNCGGTASERDALVALYNATNGPNWKTRTNWLSDKPLGEWHGVTTIGGSVWNLALRDNQLSGSMPAELGWLSNLRRLDLSRNQLTGPIPTELGSLSNLSALILRGNQLSGSIPAALGSLSNLRWLYLGSNQLSGPIPGALGGLTNLWQLSLSRNRLTGPIPTELGNLSNLQRLFLYGNSDVSGSLPGSFTSLGSLTHLFLDGTQLCAPTDAAFQTWLAGITNKRGVVNCGGGDGNGDGGTVMRDRAALVALYNATNGPNWKTRTNWLSDRPLEEWHGVTTDAEGRVVDLALYSNHLRGNIPSELGDLTNLTRLHLYNNQLSGPIPPELGQLTNLTVKLDLGNNQLSGPIPSELRQLARLTNLRLSNNRLTGPIPSWIGGLSTVTWLSLGGNSWSGPIPSELGNLSNLKSLGLRDMRLTGPIPAWLANLTNLENLYLYNNQLSGPIPAWLANLTNLTQLELSNNRLSGNVPSELGGMRNLQALFLNQNSDLSGTLPASLAGLNALGYLDLTGTQMCAPTDAAFQEWLRGVANQKGVTNCLPELDDRAVLVALYNATDGANWKNSTNWLSEAPLGTWEGVTTDADDRVTQLGLVGNGLRGHIPPELGSLEHLETLFLVGNQLSGSVPPELGNLAALTVLYLDSNQLSGSIPSELGNLGALQTLSLGNNQLSGSIPSELGNLASLETLSLGNNRLSGFVPSALGDLSKLWSLRLEDNPGLWDRLPHSLTGLTDLTILALSNTGLCAPSDDAFQAWLKTVQISNVATCQRTEGSGSPAYLAQAVQSRHAPGVPLVAGESANLVAFFTAGGIIDANGPSTRAVFYQGGSEVHRVEISRRGTLNRENFPYPVAVVPGRVIQPGLEMVIERGQDGGSWEAHWIPVEVNSVPAFNLTLVPFLWKENPDHDLVARVQALTSADSLFRLVRDLLPVRDFNLTVREPVEISVSPTGDNSSSLLRKIEATLAMDKERGHYTGGHYMGILREVWISIGGGLTLGQANLHGNSSVSILDPEVIAHELGHNLSLLHAPCGDPAQIDPDFPYATGSIGVWGYDYDRQERSLTWVVPERPDLMSYCGPRWISDYSFKKALSFRVHSESPAGKVHASSGRGLLLWGGLGEHGELILEPAFVVGDGRTSLPERSGEYHLIGGTDDGDTLFELAFDMPEFACGSGGAFAFVIPVGDDWPQRLARIRLAGPEGVVELDDDGGGPSVALLLDQTTGKVRGILRDWPDRAAAKAAAGGAMLPEEGLEVIVSTGVPDGAAWER